MTLFYEIPITIEQLVSRLEGIAKANGDSFKYEITIEPYSNANFYMFCAREAADNHKVFCGTGETINAAVNKAWNNIESNCEAWGYNSTAEYSKN